MKSKVIYKEEDVPLYLLTQSERYRLAKQYDLRTGQFYDEGHMQRVYANDGKLDKMRERMARNGGFATYGEYWDALYDDIRNFGTPTNPKVKIVHDAIEREAIPLMRIEEELKAERRQFQQQNRQLYLRDAMAYIHTRVDKRDVKGNVILSPTEWMEAYNLCTTEGARHAMFRFYRLQVIHPLTAKRSWVDYNLQPYIQRLMELGLQVEGQSGMVSDRPGIRHTSTCNGLVTPGEPECWDTVKPTTYLIVDGLDKEKNNEELIRTAIQCAVDTGWCVYRSKQTFFSMCLPLCMDGAGSPDIEKELKETGSDDDYLSVIQKLVEEHGGRAWFTDDMKKQLLEAFVSQLEESLGYHTWQKGEQLQTVRWVHGSSNLQRISAITVYRNPEGHWYIRCKIYGEQQLSHQLLPDDAEYIERIIAKDEANSCIADADMAARYFKEEIEAAEKTKKGNGKC